MKISKSVSKKKFRLASLAEIFTIQSLNIKKGPLKNNLPQGHLRVNPPLVPSDRLLGFYSVFAAREKSVKSNAIEKKLSENAITSTEKVILFERNTNFQKEFFQVIPD